MISTQSPAALRSEDAARWLRKSSGRSPPARRLDSGWIVGPEARGRATHLRRGALGGPGVDPLDAAGAAESNGLVWPRVEENHDPETRNPPFEGRDTCRPEPGRSHVWRHDPPEN